MAYGFNHSGVFESDYMDYEEPDEQLMCVCGHGADDHERNEDSGKDSCGAPDNDGALCPCDDFALDGEPDYSPTIVNIECDLCGATFSAEDFGDNTDSNCGCRRAVGEISF